MPAIEEKVLCSRCKSEMKHLSEGYAIPRGRSSNQDQNQVDLTRAINIQILRCSNPECDFIELKAPKKWPDFAAR